MKPRGRAEVIQLDIQEAQKLAVARAQIECLVVEILAEHAHEADCQPLRQLAEVCESSLETGELAEIFERDSSLHLAMAHATNNQYLHEILERLDAKVQLYRVTTCLTLEKVSEDVKQHREILDAICDGDVTRAKEAMKAHVLGLAVITT
jgi:GntR family transcriptional repressor for pyruvate dehydrogenase complex